MNDHAPEHWKRLTLGDVTDWMSGGTPSKSNPAYWGGDIPWISAKSMKNFYLLDSEDRVTKEAIENGARLVEAGDILMLVRGMTLHNDVPICVATRQMTFNQDVKSIRGVEGTDSRFIAYWLLANKANLLALVDQASHGTGRFRMDVLLSMQLQLPPLPEQRAIASVLGALDDKIELNRRMNRTLEDMAAAIFKAWFVDFEPVHAKANGAKSFPGMPQPAFDALPTAFSNSNSDPLPEGWEVGSVADIAWYVNGKAFTKNANGCGRMIIRIAELNSGPGGSTKYGEIEAAPENTAYPDDILFAWSGSLDVYRWHRDEAIINQHIFKVIPDDWPQWFVYHQLRSVMPFFQSIASTKATTMGHIKRGHLNEALIVIPPQDIAEQASSAIESLYELVHTNQKESLILAETRDALLPKLLSGELKVSNVEAITCQ